MGAACESNNCCGPDSHNIDTTNQVHSEHFVSKNDQIYKVDIF